MKEIPISARRREGTGKGVARRERMASRIPGVVYGPEIDPVSVSVDERDMRAAMKASAGVFVIFNLDVDGKVEKVIMRDLQRDPVTTKITHIDFHAIALDKPLSTSIPIVFKGVPVGVKTDGGIMQTTMRELDISCLPQDVPDQLELDVTELGIGDSIHVRDVELGEVRILAPEQRTIVVIAAPTVVKETVTEEGEEGEELEGEAAEGEGAEGAAEGEEAKAEGGEEKKE